MKCPDRQKRLKQQVIRHRLTRQSDHDKLHVTHHAEARGVAQEEAGVVQALSDGRSCCGTFTALMVLLELFGSFIF